MPKDRMAMQRAADAIQHARKIFEGDDVTIIWRMIADIIEWCDAQSPRVNFDLYVEEAREHCREND